MMPVSKAMDKTGAGKLIASWAVSLMERFSVAMVVTMVLFIISCGLTQFMSNTASAALLCPIGIAISPNSWALLLICIDGYRRSCILRIRNSGPVLLRTPWYWAGGYNI